MAKRKSPPNRVGMVSPMRDQTDKHEEMLSDMHSALHTLGDKIRGPYMPQGSKLLPDKMNPTPPPGGAAARAHIAKLHKGFKALKGGK